MSQRLPGPDLTAIAAAASREAGGVPVGLLGDYLPAAAEAAASGRRLTAAELSGYGRSGEQAALSGVALRGLIDLYLSATWRLWRELPAGTSPTAVRAAGLAVLRAADDAVAAAAEGFERALLTVARREEAERREFFDDLLSGRGGAGDLIVRGDRLGLRLAGPHQVVVAGPAAAGATLNPAGVEVEAVVAAAAAPSPALVATRGGRVVAITGAADGKEADRVARALARLLAQAQPRTGPAAAATGHAPAGTGHAPGEGAEPSPPWRIVVGRPYPGPSGVVRSYEEAAEALDIAERSACRTVATPRTCSSTRSCCATGRPSPIWCAPCSCRCEPPAAARHRCWPPWRPTSPMVASPPRQRGTCICRFARSPTGWPGSGT